MMKQITIIPIPQIKNLNIFLESKVTVETIMKNKTGNFSIMRKIKNSFLELLIILILISINKIYKVFIIVV